MADDPASELAGSSGRLASAGGPIDWKTNQSLTEAPAAGSKLQSIPSTTHDQPQDTPRPAIRIVHSETGHTAA